MRRGILLLAAAVLSLGGCFERKLTVPFNEAEYARLERSGTGVVEGQAFLLTEGGDVKKGAGKPVSLVPVTSASTEIHKVTHVGMMASTGWDPRMQAYNITVTADGDGRFRFENVPPGEYYVYCWIAWKWYNSGVLSETGGWAYATATVRNGETTKVVVTR